jgi:acyl transferase domain-containing protein
MIEGHGTATLLGDRTELQSLAQTYGATAPGRGALLGSVKSNVGHAQAAAGALGLAKVLVSAEHGAVPASLHTDQASREIDWDSQGLRLASKLTPWPAVDGQRLAAVSAFGMSGTNAHADRVDARQRGCLMDVSRLPDGRVPVLLSAHAEELIAADAQAIIRYLDREPGLHAVTATLLRTRKQRRHRAVVRAADTRELADGLRALAAGDDHPLVTRSSESSTPRTAFVFPGQGNQWPTMGADAYRQLPVYRAEMDKCADAFVAAGAESPLPYLIDNIEPGTSSQIQIQAAQFTHAAGLAQVWRSCGIAPDITVGHSLGEVAAAYTAEAITLADGVAVVIARAKVVDGLPGRYGMAVLGISADEAEKLIAKTSGWLELSVVNADTSVVVSGDRDAIATIVTATEEQGTFAREIAVNFPAHTSALDALHSELLSLLPRGQFTDAAVQFIGSATGTWWHRARTSPTTGIATCATPSASTAPSRPPCATARVRSSSCPRIRRCCSRSATSLATAQVSRH